MDLSLLLKFTITYVLQHSVDPRYRLARMTFALVEYLSTAAAMVWSDLSNLCPPPVEEKCHGQKRSLRCQGSRVKYELVEESDDIVFCHRLFQEVFAYHHVVTR